MDGSSRLLPRRGICPADGGVESDQFSKYGCRLPAGTGRHQGVGNGGFLGSVAYESLVPALKRGYAASSTDTGHQGNTLAFGAKSQQLLEDYAASAHHTAVASKAIIGAFYGGGPNYSYFTGCSTGGKQGLWEAQRHPEDYD